MDGFRRTRALDYRPGCLVSYVQLKKQARSFQFFFLSDEWLESLPLVLVLVALENGNVTLLTLPLSLFKVLPKHVPYCISITKVVTTHKPLRQLFPNQPYNHKPPIPPSLSFLSILFFPFEPLAS